MKCKECNCCKLGYFKSKPDAYVCIGVKNPFIINNIDVECTEYPEKRDDCINKEIGNNSMTNADTIRSMNDEELSLFLWKFDVHSVSREEGCFITRRKLLEWLQSPKNIF